MKELIKKFKNDSPLDGEELNQLIEHHTKLEELLSYHGEILRLSLFYTSLHLGCLKKLKQQNKANENTN